MPPVANLFERIQGAAVGAKGGATLLATLNCVCRQPQLVLMATSMITRPINRYWLFIPRPSLARVWGSLLEATSCQKDRSSAECPLQATAVLHLGLSDNNLADFDDFVD